MFAQGDVVIRKEDNKRMTVLKMWEGQRTEEDGTVVKVPMANCTWVDRGARFGGDYQETEISPARDLRLVK